MPSLYFWFVAGETSGDARASEVMVALRKSRPDIRFGGAGGPRMQALADGPFDNWTAQAAVLGLWDVLKHYGYFRTKFHRMLEAVAREAPDAIVLVDYPGFNLRLAKALRKTGFAGKILYYISPQVWAWNRGRIPKMARILDLMICVFPFEAPMYEASGLHTVFTGHPLLEALGRERREVVRERRLLGFFPGSREREIRRIFPVMVAAATIISKECPDVRFEVAAASAAHAALLRGMCIGTAIAVHEGRAHELMQRSTAGIVCSGTATLEAAFFGLPYCLIYKVAWLTFEVGRRLVDLDCLGIINVLNNYRTNPPTDPSQPTKPAPHVVKEFIQHGATPAAVAAEALRLLRDESARSLLAAELATIVSALDADGASHRAASALLDAALPAKSPRLIPSPNR